jgi:small subunit ribosomal protein S27e
LFAVNNVLLKIKNGAGKMASKFWKIRCLECNNEQITFSHATREVLCLGCGNLLLEPTGGKAHILKAEIVEEY